MEPFRFKLFQVFDHLSTMKVGTDSVTLGAYSSRFSFDMALDIGTGCGLIALMLAQKSSGEILAIDIDEPSVQQAIANFAESPWSGRLTSRCISTQDLALEVGGIFDRIVSNPPFFNDSLTSPDARRTNARHNTTLSHQELAAAVNQLLAPDGVFDVILPNESAMSFRKIMNNIGLFVNEELVLYSVFDRPIRTIMSFARTRKEHTICQHLTIRNQENRHTQEYIDFTEDFFPYPK